MRDFYNILHTYATYISLKYCTSPIKNVPKHEIKAGAIDPANFIRDYLQNADGSMGIRKTNSTSYMYKSTQERHGNKGSSADPGPALASLYLKKEGVKTNYVKGSAFIELMTKESDDLARKLKTCTPAEYIHLWIAQGACDLTEWSRKDLVGGLPLNRSYSSVQTAAFLASALKDQGASTLVSLCSESEDTIGQWIPEGATRDTLTMAHQMCTLLKEERTYGALLSYIFGAEEADIACNNYAGLSCLNKIWARQEQIINLRDQIYSIREMRGGEREHNERGWWWKGDNKGTKSPELEEAIRKYLKDFFRCLQAEIEESGVSILAGVGPLMIQNVHNYHEAFAHRTLAGDGDWDQAINICTEVVLFDPETYCIGAYL